MSYGERAQRLSQIVATLQANRDDYYAIATANSGTVATDSAVDIDGAIYTLSTYAKLGATLGDAHTLLDGAAVPLAKDASFAVRHVFRPTPGVALFINAFNFPRGDFGRRPRARCSRACRSSSNRRHRPPGSRNAWWPMWSPPVCCRRAACR